MGRYDDITPEELRAQLLRLARLIRAMEKRDVLLQKTASILKLLGELRQMIFAYEVRVTRNLVPSDSDDAVSDAETEDSLRIVREALERERELRDELRNFLLPDDPDR